MKAIWLAVGWGVFALAFSRAIEGAMVGWNDSITLWVAAPVLEELTKWVGYKSVRAYSILIPITFCVGEVFLKLFDWNANTIQLVGQEALASAILMSIAVLFLLKHVAFWAIPYLFNFRWYAFPAAVLYHSAWNLVNTVGRAEELQVTSAIVTVALLLPMAIVLMKQGKE